jgi:GLPGLI family protein
MNDIWKFNGLLGLIVEVYDTKKEVIFLLNKIEVNKDEIILINYPEKYQKTTTKEYTQLR